jgi:hypothetical protein
MPPIEAQFDLLRIFYAHGRDPVHRGGDVGWGRGDGLGLGARRDWVCALPGLRLQLMAQGRSGQQTLSHWRDRMHFMRR